MDCTNCGHSLDIHSLNPRNNAGVCFGEGPKGPGHCECSQFGVEVPDTPPEAQ